MGLQYEFEVQGISFLKKKKKKEVQGMRVLLLTELHKVLLNFVEVALFLVHSQSHQEMMIYTLIYNFLRF